MRPLPVWKCEDIDLDTRECSIEFGSIEIREYSRELGVYSDLKNGLALGWDYEQHAPIRVSDYQKQEKPKQPVESRGGLKKALKKLKGSSVEERPVCTGIMPTTTNERQKILTGFGYSKDEIERAERDRLQKLGYSSTNITKVPSVIRRVQRACAMSRRAK